MTTPTAIAQTVLDTLKANIADIDFTSLASYLPAIQSNKIAVIGVAVGHQDEMSVLAFGIAQMVHTLRYLVWTKVTQGQDAVSQKRARDFGYNAMQVLIANDEAGYSLNWTEGAAPAITYTVDPVLVSEAGQAYIAGVLTVAVVQQVEI